MAAANSPNLQMDAYVPMVIDEKVRIKSRSGRIYDAYIKSIHDTATLSGIEVVHVTKGGGFVTRLIPWIKIMGCVRRYPKSDDDEDGMVALFESEAEELDTNASRLPEPTPAQRGYPSTSKPPQPHPSSVRAATPSSSSSATAASTPGGVNSASAPTTMITPSATNIGTTSEAGGGNAPSQL